MHKEMDEFKEVNNDRGDKRSCTVKSLSDGWSQGVGKTSKWKKTEQIPPSICWPLFFQSI